MLGIILVDLQNDFSEVGALPVKDASLTIPVINKFLAQLQSRSVVVYSKDWHPLNHCSFTQNGGTWPTHCVQGSKGAELIDGLAIPVLAKGFKKGYDPIVDSYSAFGGVSDDIDQFSLGTYLKQNGVDTVYVMGLATDYCVSQTVLDAVKLGFKTIFVENASKGVDQSTTDAAIQNMAKAGVTFMNTY